jgi:hypothetical protein
MLTIQYFLSSTPGEAAPPNLPEFAEPWRRRRLRLYLVGSDEDTQQFINYLHLHGCIERIEWTPRAIAIPENGIVIRRDPGDVLRYLQRDRPFQ